MEKPRAGKHAKMSDEPEIEIDGMNTPGSSARIRTQNGKLPQQVPPVSEEMQSWRAKSPQFEEEQFDYKSSFAESHGEKSYSGFSSFSETSRREGASTRETGDSYAMLESGSFASSRDSFGSSILASSIRASSVRESSVRASSYRDGSSIRDDDSVIRDSSIGGDSSIRDSSIRDSSVRDSSFCDSSVRESSFSSRFSSDSAMSYTV